MELLLFHKIEERNHDRLLSGVHVFPPDFQARLKQYTRWQDYQLSVMGRALLSFGLKIMGLTKHRWQHIQYTAFGKPYLDGGPHFSITHSGEYVACMISEERILGIDLEIQRPIDLSEFQYMFHPQEWRVLEQTPDILACFYGYWTLKEAVIKAHGSGLNISLSTLNVTGKTCQLDNSTWHLYPSYTLPGYSFAIAANKPAPFPAPVHHISLEEALPTLLA